MTENIPIQPENISERAGSSEKDDLLKRTLAELRERTSSEVSNFVLAEGVVKAAKQSQSGLSNAQLEVLKEFVTRETLRQTYEPAFNRGLTPEEASREQLEKEWRKFSPGEWKIILEEDSQIAAAIKYRQLLEDARTYYQMWQTDNPASQEEQK